MIERTKKEYQQQAGGIFGWSHGRPIDFARPFGGRSIERDAVWFLPSGESRSPSSHFGGWHGWFRWRFPSSTSKTQLPPASASSLVYSWNATWIRGRDVQLREGNREETITFILFFSGSFILNNACEKLGVRSSTVLLSLRENNVNTECHANVVS